MFELQRSVLGALFACGRSIYGRWRVSYLSCLQPCINTALPTGTSLPKNRHDLSLHIKREQNAYWRVCLKWQLTIEFSSGGLLHPTTPKPTPRKWSYYILCLCAIRILVLWSCSLLVMRDLVNNSRDNAGVTSYDQIKGAIQSRHLKLRIKWECLFRTN